MQSWDCRHNDDGNNHRIKRVIHRNSTPNSNWFINGRPAQLKQVSCDLSYVDEATWQVWKIFRLAMAEVILMKDHFISSVRLMV